MAYLQFKILLLMTLTMSVCLGRFDRVCDGGHCMFRPMGSDAEAYLSCGSNGKCACDYYRYIADVPAWRFDDSDGVCRIAVSGPCGVDGELEVKCQTGHECLKGRCRDPSKLRKNPLNYSCNDELDCQPELVCKPADFYYRIVKRCVTPETPAYDPAVGRIPPPRPRP